MKSYSLFILSIATLALVATSCTKPGGSSPTGGGLGGNATICIVPEHHGFLLDSATVYIKYGTLDAPAAGVMYDDSVVCTMQVAPADTTPRACFSGLKTGVYYFFSQGYHPGYGPVKGGGNWTVYVGDTQQNGAVYIQNSIYNN